MKLQECKAQKHYKWSKVEETKEGEPITNIVDIVSLNLNPFLYNSNPSYITTLQFIFILGSEIHYWKHALFQGLSAPSLSSDCVGGLLRELTYHSSTGRFPLLVTIDYANSLYGKTTMKDRNHKLVDPKYFTLIHHLRKLLRNDWVRCLLNGKDLRRM